MTKEFKKDEYIVLLQSFSINCIKSNYVYKQQRDYECLIVKDLVGDTNTLQSISYDKSPSWRYATKFEIEAYDNNNGPVDINKINREPDINQLLQIAIKKYPIGTKYKPLTSKGDPFKDKYCITKLSRFNLEDWSARITVDLRFLYVNGNWAPIIELPIQQEDPFKLTKMDLNTINDEVFELVQKEAFKYGYFWTGGKNTIKKLSEIGGSYLYFNNSKLLSTGINKSTFDMSQHTVITVENLGITLPPTIDLSNTKIWIGNDKELCKKVLDKAFELGWRWMNDIDANDNFWHEYTIKSLYFDDKYKVTQSDNHLWYGGHTFKELHPQELGILNDISAKGNIPHPTGQLFYMDCEVQSYPITTKQLTKSIINFDID